MAARSSILWGVLVLGSGCPQVRSPPSTDQFGEETTAAMADTTGTSSGSSDDESSSGGSSGAPPQSPAQTACTALCATEGDCGSDVDPYLCEIACGQELAASLDLPGCVPAQIDLITCLAELDCEALAETTADPASPHCAEVRALADEVCDPTCTVASSMTNVEAMTCSAVFSCGATERAVDCVAEACTCTLDGEVVGSCVGEPDCAWFGETMGAPYWMELGVSCCGFPGPSR